jgi:N-acetyl-anhydromuramyl-L-alanine amidase AmpD
MIPELNPPPKRIILHWTAGTYVPNSTDLKSYHYLIDGQGKVHVGVPVEKNMRSLTGIPMSDYAAHCRGLNSFSVGVALCGMHGATPGGPYGKFPITQRQWISAALLVVSMTKAWDLPINSRTVLHHKEVEHVYKVKQSKWDLTELPWDRSVAPHETGNVFRNMVFDYASDYLRPVPPPIVWAPLRKIPAPVVSRSNPSK